MQNPNILVILSDQLRRRALGCYGDPNVSTPNIDTLARTGTRFTNACSTYPICVPFRFTLMTGEYAHSRYVPAIEWRMSPAERTLADEFNEAGYDTIYCGKWHLHGGHGQLPHHTCRKTNLTPIPRTHQGRWQKWMAFDVANNPFDTYYFEDANPQPKKLKGYQTDGLFDLTMNHLASRESGRPFMCILSVEPPHFPLDAPEEYMRKWESKEINLPPNFLHVDDRPSPGTKVDDSQRDQLLKNMRTYYAMIENLDWNVGRMISFLEETGLRQDTIVVFLSDHGQMDGSHSETSIIKDHPFEESIGIPFIVAPPISSCKQGQVVSTPIASEDLFPTLLGLAGIGSSERGGPGLDASLIIRGEEEDLPRKGVLLEFVHDLRPGTAYHEMYWRGFRTKRYKYTVLGNARDGGTPWQFFDLQEDPYEKTNLIADKSYQTLVIEHHRLMYERMLETDDHYVLAPSFGMDGLNMWMLNEVRIGQQGAAPGAG